MRIRQHVNPLKSDLLSIADVPRIQPAPGTLLEVELGSGEAHYLVDRARAEPETSFIGVEIRRDMVARANRECTEAGVVNVRSVFANMSTDLPRLFAPQTVRRFHLNFPDPWFKTRQHKRRVVGPSLVRHMRSLLAPAGEIFVATDVFEIALDAMAAFEEATLTNLASPWSFLPARPYAARSRRERQCEADGTRVWRLGYCDGGTDGDDGRPTHPKTSPIAAPRQKNL